MSTNDKLRRHSEREVNSGEVTGVRTEKRESKIEKRERGYEKRKRG